MSVLNFPAPYFLSRRCVEFGSFGVRALAPESKAHYSWTLLAHRAETTLSEDGVITLRDIPFRRGESAEVIVLPFAGVAASGSRYPLRGTPVTLLAPTEPVAEADWEVVGVALAR